MEYAIVPKKYNPANNYTGQAIQSTCGPTIRQRAKLRLCNHRYSSITTAKSIIRHLFNFLPIPGPRSSKLRNASPGPRPGHRRWPPGLTSHGRKLLRRQNACLQRKPTMIVEYRVYYWHCFKYHELKLCKPCYRPGRNQTRRLMLILPRGSSSFPVFQVALQLRASGSTVLMGWHRASSQQRPVSSPQRLGQVVTSCIIMPFWSCHWVLDDLHNGLDRLTATCLRTFLSNKSDHRTLLDTAMYGHGVGYILEPKRPVNDLGSHRFARVSSITLAVLYLPRSLIYWFK